MTVTILVLLVVLVVLLTARTLQAQTEPAPPPPAPAATDDSVWKNVRFGATLEGYYQDDWNRPPDRVLALRAYDTRANVFSIQQAAFVIDAAPDVSAGRRYGLRADLQFGQATETVQGSAANEPRPDVVPSPVAGLRVGTCFRWALACRRISASSRRCSATRPTTRRTIRPFPAPTSSTFCPSTTRVCV